MRVAFSNIIVQYFYMTYSVIDFVKYVAVLVVM